MRLQDNIRKCYYEFDRQRGLISRNGKFDVYSGNIIASKGYSKSIYVLELKNTQSLSAIAMRDVLKCQMNSPELLKVYSFIESRDPSTGKMNAYGILEYADGVTLDRFIVGEIKGCSSAAMNNIRALYSEYANDREKFATKLIQDLTTVTETLNNNGFSIANFDPSSIIITGNNTIKMLDYGIPINQISPIQETATLGRTLYYLITGSSYAGTLTRLQSKKIRSIVKRSIANKYTSIQMFRNAFEERSNWWKYFWYILAGILLIMMIGFGIIRLCSSISEEESDDSFDYSSAPSEVRSTKPDGVTYEGSFSGETDFAGGLNKLKPIKKVVKKKAPNEESEVKEKTNDSENEEIIDSKPHVKEKVESKKGKDSKISNSPKNIVF